MSRRSAARALVRALRPVIESHIERHGAQTVRATITHLEGTPGARVFIADVHFYGLTLTNENTTFAQALVAYDEEVGVVVGDTLIAHEMDDDDWAAVAIQSDTDV